MFLMIFKMLFFDALAQSAIENPEKAIDLLHKARKADPDKAAVYFELGKNYKTLKQYEKLI